MRSNLWQPAVPCNGNLWFPRWQQLSSNLWEPAVPCHEPNANILAPVHEAKQKVLLPAQ